MEGEFGISQPVRRREDRRFLTGRGTYTGDIDLDGQAHGAFVRSDHAHGTIHAVEVEAARAMPGVLAVFTGADLQAAGVDTIPYLPVPGFELDDPVATPRPVLAIERVRYVGEQLALVIAETEPQARDAAERVGVDIAPLPAVTDIAAATAGGAPRLWPGADDNVVLNYHFGDREAVAVAFDGAAHVTRLKLINNRVIANPMETRSVVAAYDRGADLWSLFAGSQGVTYYLRALAEGTLRAPPEKFHLRTHDVGGAFGSKEFPYPEDVAILFAAKQLGRPLKWTGTRGEHFLSDNHARDASIDCALALDQDGTFLALRATVATSLGAYCSHVAPITPIRNTTFGLPTVYRTPLIEATHRMVTTNCAPVGPYRGAGREQGVLIVERLIDQAAREMAIDPIALRRRNVIPKSAIPYRTPTGRLYDSGDFEAVLDRALKLADWDGFGGRAAVNEAAGKIRGRGISFFLEPVGGVPFESCDMRFAEDGSVTAVMATQSHGQGHETSFAQVIGDRLGLSEEMISIAQGDSRDVPKGIGSFASRSMIMGGSAIAHSCRLVIEKGIVLAAHMFQVPPEEVTFSDGLFAAADTNRSIDVGELAAWVQASDDLPDALPDSLNSVGEYVAEDFHFPNGCHICEIEIDPETGTICVDSYVAVDDVGTVINPMIVHGQIEGGVAQGLGQALIEAIVYGADGQLATASLMDYALPRAADFPAPDVALHPVPSPANPLGVKGCGEAGVTGSVAAISNAVADALARAGVAAALDMPFTPEKIWRALTRKG